MTALYVETSAVAAWLFGEPASGDVMRAMNAADTVVTSVLTIVETERAIRRAVATRVIKESAAPKLRGAFARERSKWVTMALTADVLARAGLAFPVEPLRTLVAIHLATALAFTEALPDLTILALDRRVRVDAESLGLVVA